MRGLSGKHTIVTGGAQGIGHAVVERLHEEGVEVVVFDVDGRKGADLALIPGVTLELCDVGAENDVAAATRRVVERHGGVDILVNNAGLMAYYDALHDGRGGLGAAVGGRSEGRLAVRQSAVPAMQARGEGAS